MEGSCEGSAVVKQSPEYVILEDFNFTQGRLYSRYNLPQLDLYLGYLLNLLIVISWTILAKSAPPPALGKNSVIRGFSVVKATFYINVALPIHVLYSFSSLFLEL
jgi:hypothetical protein